MRWELRTDPARILQGYSRRASECPACSLDDASAFLLNWDWVEEVVLARQACDESDDDAENVLRLARGNGLGKGVRYQIGSSGISHVPILPFPYLTLNSSPPIRRSGSRMVTCLLASRSSRTGSLISCGIGTVDAIARETLRRWQDAPREPLGRHRRPNILCSREKCGNFPFLEGSRSLRVVDADEQRAALPSFSFARPNQLSFCTTKWAFQSFITNAEGRPCVVNISLRCEGPCP